jgi:hypothetical protein
MQVSTMESKLPLRTEFEDKVQGLMDTSTKIEQRLLLLEEKENRWNTLVKLMEENSSKSKEKIRLDIGGKIFATTKTTLLLKEGTYFHALLSSGHWKPDEDGDDSFTSFERSMFRCVLCRPESEALRPNS